MLYVVRPGQKEILRVLPFLDGSLASLGFDDFKDETIAFLGAGVVVVVVTGTVLGVTLIVGSF